MRRYSDQLCLTHSNGTNSWSIGCCPRPSFHDIAPTGLFPPWLGRWIHADTRPLAPPRKTVCPVDPILIVPFGPPTPEHLGSSSDEMAYVVPINNLTVWHEPSAHPMR